MPIPHRDIIVIGASSGGLDALSQIVMGLPQDLPAAVLIVLHIAADAPRSVAKRLDDLGPLHACWATEGEPLESGRIYLAPPDRHLIVENKRLRLTRGPRESFCRPSIDVLFRSAAYEYGSRVIGVVLTGRLDDGTAGLWSIKDRGGIAVVQLPEDAACPSMPLSALRHVDVDYKLPVRDMPARLASLLRESASAGEAAALPNERLEIESKIALGQIPVQAGRRFLGNAIDEGDLWSALAQLEQYQMLLSDLQRNSGSEGDAVARRSTEIGDLIQRVRELALHPAR